MEIKLIEIMDEVTMRKKVILITDGDIYATRAIIHVAKVIGGTCIIPSSGNPSIHTGEELIQYILEAKKEPVLVMFDDSGIEGIGRGEQALLTVAKHPQIEVLGVLAVAAHTKHSEWTKIDVSIDREGNLTPFGVDKDGLQELELGRINGDTVYCLDSIDVPIVVGIGDIGKMYGNDCVERGAPITQKAIELILERSGFND